MKKILITGSTGMLGSDLVRSFTAVGRYDVYGLSRGSNPLLPESNQFKVDLSHTSLLDGFSFKPDVIIHTAAITDLHLCERDPELAHMVNVEGTESIARWAGEKTVFYYISTDSVFDGEKGYYSETDIPNPLNVYGETKLAGERAARARNSGNTSVIRTNIYGFHSPMKSSLAEWAYGEWKQGRTITGFSDTIFNAVFTSQLSKILQIMIDENIVHPVLNIGSNNAISKYDFLNKFRKSLQLGNEKSLKNGESINFPSQVKRPRNTSLDTNLLSTFCIVPDFDSGLKAWIEQATEQGLLKN